VLAQHNLPLQLIVVNDRSMDGTGRVVAELASRDSRVRIVEVRELPSGLYGKPHAISKARPLLGGEFVAFVDSDFRLKPGCLSAIVRHVQDEQLDWLALMGAPDLHSFWERLLVPLFGAIAYAWYDPRAIGDPHSPVAIGSGFMCARRSAYEAIGGHAAVAGAYDEDSAILRQAKRSGQRVAYVLAPDLFTVRFYGNLKRTVHGMTRTCIGGIKSLPRMFVTLNAVHFVSLVPLEIFAALAVARERDIQVAGTPLWTGMALAHFALACALCGLIYGRARASRWLSLLHPLGAVFVIWICLRATRGLLRRGPITWRGTTY
jgi:chlorobactene glucosyltransferase